jgi:hypothetical protein
MCCLDSGCEYPSTTGAGSRASGTTIFYYFERRVASDYDRHVRHVLREPMSPLGLFFTLSSCSLTVFKAKNTKELHLNTVGRKSSD